MQNSQIRQQRVQQLYQFATITRATKKQIITKALSMGVSNNTANDYYRSVHAMQEVKK